MAPNLPTLFAYGELEDGTTWANVRVTLPTKIQFEKSAKANRWDTDADDFTVQAFMSWHAAKLAGHHDLAWEEFLRKTVDAGVTGKRLPDEDTDPAEDPTRPGAGTE